MTVPVIGIGFSICSCLGCNGIITSHTLSLKTRVAIVDPGVHDRDIDGTDLAR